MLRAISVIVVLVVLGCQDKVQDSSSPEWHSPTEGGPGLTFTLPLVDGTTLAADTLAGSVVLINFWDTWCGPCRQEQPDLNALYAEFHSAGLEIVGVSLALNGLTEVTEYIAANNVEYPSGIINSSIQAIYGYPPAIPRSYLINRAGNIASEHTGRMTYNEFTAAIAPLLEE
ncbi:MAG: TlpA family protein disulfide reductase [bacterium]|nr:TlpA family protein disulfide reductase [bacterium]